jgi:hypothetical protein
VDVRGIAQLNQPIGVGESVIVSEDRQVSFHEFEPGI